MLEQWISSEPAHQNNIFEWYQAGKTMVFEDDLGPVFVARFAPVIRIDMEFPPDIDKERIRAMLTSEFPGVARGAKEQGFKELVFNSVSKSLIAFCRAFGFEPCPDEFRKEL